MLRDINFALRNLLRNKVLAAINVLGLSIGITGCLVIFLIVDHEMSFDRFQPDREFIYRVHMRFNGIFTGVNSGVSTGVPVLIQEKFTGVDAVTNFHTFSASVKVPVNGESPREFRSGNKIVIADAAYFDVFRYYRWKIGSPSESLSKPFQVAIAESRAKMYFGDVDLQSVIGRQIHYRDSLVAYVSGIFEDVPSRTDLDFTEFISFRTIESSWLKETILWNDLENTNSSSQAFIRLSPGTSREKIEAQLPALSKIIAEKINNPSWVTTVDLQPLSDLHFNPELGIFDGSRSVVNKSTLQILGLIAALLLIMATVNFINLETAQASRRAKEVGVRKVLGSSRMRLVIRFIVESFVLTFCAIFVSLMLAQLIMPVLSDFIPPGLTVDPTDPALLVFLVVVAVGVTALAGLYPAFVLSSFQPAVALKNVASVASGGSRTAFVRKGLTVFQFAFSQILILGTVTIGLQLQYMLNKDMGFTSDGILYLRAPEGEKAERMSLYRNALVSVPEIGAVCQCQPPASTSHSTSIMTFDKGGETVRHNVAVKYADTGYLHVYDIDLLAGRNLTPVDSVHEYLINETYMRLLGFESPDEAVGETVNERYRVVGVVRDFHTHGLQTAIGPTAIRFTGSAPIFAVRLSGTNVRVVNIASVITKMEGAWKQIYPSHPFEVQFYNDAIRRLYENEQRAGKLATIATAVAILISCLGLFGLSSFTVVQRTKEIGIRKVLGATVNSIVLLLSKEFLLLVGIAFVLSTPFAWLAARWWLENFAYRIEPGVLMFALSGVLSVAIAFITVGFRTLSAAKADPVESLRYE